MKAEFRTTPVDTKLCDVSRFQNSRVVVNYDWMSVCDTHALARVLWTIVLFGFTVNFLLLGFVVTTLDAIISEKYHQSHANPAD